MWWQWHELEHMQIMCISLQTDNYANIPPGRMPFLPPNQQSQSNEGTFSGGGVTKRDSMADKALYLVRPSRHLT